MVTGEKYTYDSNGKVLTHKNSDGYFKTLVHGEDYTLMYVKSYMSHQVVV